MSRPSVKSTPASSQVPEAVHRSAWEAEHAVNEPFAVTNVAASCA